MQTLRAFGLAVLVLALAACGTSQPRTFTGQFDRPAAGSRIIIMTPDVQLSMLTTTGIQEPRADWSQSGRDNLLQAVGARLQTRSHAVSTLDPRTAMDGRQGQIIRLHEAVGLSIAATHYLGAPLPTRRDNFEWTLGEGAREIGVAHNADYAIFITAVGSYASSGRVLAMIGMAALGVGIPLGGQQVVVSLVDLRTGHIIWFNVVLAAPGEDMRNVEGATRLTENLLREIPL